MNAPLKIAVVEPSLIIRSGLLSVLGRLNGLNIQIVEIGQVDQLAKSLGWQQPDVLIVNPSLLGLFSLERIKGVTPAAKPAVSAAPAAEAAMQYDSGSVADEIAHNVEALVGSTEDTAPKAEPRHPTADTTTSRFANLNLQFGRNYDPTHK